MHVANDYLLGPSPVPSETVVDVKLLSPNSGGHMWYTRKQIVESIFAQTGRHVQHGEREMGIMMILLY